MSLFKAILKASGRKSKDGNAKGGIKSHVQIRLLDELPMNVRYVSSSVLTDRLVLRNRQLLVVRKPLKPKSSATTVKSKNIQGANKTSET